MILATQAKGKKVVMIIMLCGICNIEKETLFRPSIVQSKIQIQHNIMYEMFNTFQTKK